MATETKPKRPRKPRKKAEPELFDVVLLAHGRRPELHLRAVELGDALYAEHEHNVVRGRLDALAVVVTAGMIQRFF